MVKRGIISVGRVTSTGAFGSIGLAIVRHSCGHFVMPVSGFGSRAYGTASLRNSSVGCTWGLITRSSVRCVRFAWRIAASPGCPISNR
jgi:hypothetical protein